jgi:hypothetical protein
MFKLYLDRRAASRGVAGALAAPRRSGWLGLFGFFLGLLFFPFGAGVVMGVAFTDIFMIWIPSLFNSAEEARWYGLCLFGCGLLSVLIFFAAHFPFHKKHLPWYAGREA